MKKVKFLTLLSLGLGLILFAGCGRASSNKEYANFNSDRIIEYQHIKHGISETYAAVILFEYEMDNYTKYQVSYLSCTCRSASENYQHLLYVELNNNNASAEEATIRNIEYQFWGDSPVNPENGVTYDDIKREYLPYLLYKSKAQIDKLTSLKDLVDAGQVERNGAKVDANSGASVKDQNVDAERMEGNSKKYNFVDAYSGASVSIDNSLAILHALFKYHAEKYYKK